MKALAFLMGLVWGAGLVACLAAAALVLGAEWLVKVVRL